MQPPITLNTPGIRYSFKVGDMAVHPAHGVGEVERLEDRDFGGRMTTVYVIKIRDSGLKVMVPTVGKPSVVIVNSPPEPTVNVVSSPLVNPGACCTVNVTFCSALGSSPLLAVKERAYTPPMSGSGVP